MLLLIDAGNTSTTIGFCDKAGISNTLRLDTMPEAWGSGEYPGLLNDFIRGHQLKMPDGASICSVVPAVTPLISAALKKNYGINPVIVDHGTMTGLKFLRKNIEGLGPDRISNAVAARGLYKGNLVVLDFGTATTVCVITEEGVYMGAAIMPGPALSAACLAERTARLPLVELRTPVSLMGGDTESDILTGIILGHAGAVERIINEINGEIKGDLNVVATGGLADLVTPYMKMIDYVNPLLTLEGLRLIYEINPKGGVL